LSSNFYLITVIITSGQAYTSQRRIIAMFNKKIVLTGITLITTLMLASPSFLSGIRELIFSGRDYRAAFIRNRKSYFRRRRISGIYEC